MCQFKYLSVFPGLINVFFLQPVYTWLKISAEHKVYFEQVLFTVETSNLVSKKILIWKFFHIFFPYIDLGFHINLHKNNFYWYLLSENSMKYVHLHVCVLVSTLTVHIHILGYTHQLDVLCLLEEETRWNCTLPLS